MNMTGSQMTSTAIVNNSIVGTASTNQNSGLIS
jgi:hypothetical protein